MAKETEDDRLPVASYSACMRRLLRVHSELTIAEALCPKDEIILSLLREARKSISNANRLCDDRIKNG